MMKVLLTGGAGYIGSHAAIELIKAGHDVVIVDNFSNSSPEVLRRLEKITSTSLPFFEGDVADKPFLESVFSDNEINAVIHFAGLKAVGESVEKPLLYYQNNLGSTLTLLEVMDASNVRKLVFSSSATVYGNAAIPYREDMPTGYGITNPYGQTKYVIEQLLHDVSNANAANEFTILRYFNPIGAHPSGLIGEHPNGIPNNLMPYITQVATGKRPELQIFGDDYDTKDGTGVRDYIHVMDLASGHVAALEHSKPGIEAYNLGTGKGVSVLELVRAFERSSSRSIPYAVVKRRPGDLPLYYADPQKAERQLDWKTVRSVEDACRDSWRWQSNNPSGL